MFRVVAVDTNVWVSAFLTPHGYPAQLKLLWQANRFDVVVSLPLLAELAEVLTRSRLQRKYGYSADDISAYVRLIAKLADLASITGTLNICRDPDDDILLETAIVGRATHVVSRDEDVMRDADLIQRLAERGITALTVQRFLSELKALGEGAAK